MGIAEIAVIARNRRDRDAPMPAITCDPSVAGIRGRFRRGSLLDFT